MLPGGMYRDVTVPYFLGASYLEIVHGSNMAMPLPSIIVAGVMMFLATFCCVTSGALFAFCRRVNRRMMITMKGTMDSTDMSEEE
jgi:hypothetical protein